MDQCEQFDSDQFVSFMIVVWPSTSCFADWLKRRHVTLRIIDCQEGVEYLQHVKS